MQQRSRSGNLWTGLFELEQTDIYLPDVIPISLTRTYRTRDWENHPFGKGTTHPYAMFLFNGAAGYQEADLVLPDGVKIHFVRTSAGVGFTDAVFEHKETETTSATPTGFYKAVMRWNGLGWDIRLKDGTVYVFGENAPLQLVPEHTLEPAACNTASRDGRRRRAAGATHARSLHPGS